MIWAISAFLLAAAAAVVFFCKTWYLPPRKGFVAAMYHHIGVRDVTDPQYAFTVTPAQLETHFQLLQKHGFTTVGLDDLQNPAALKKPFLMTFDDGYEELYTVLWPLLKKYNAKAAVFLISGFVGKPGYLNKAQILEMQASGLVSFGSHGVNHLRLRHLPDEEIRRELTQSKAELEELLGRPVTAFCYPFGAGGFDKRVRPLVFKSGYAFDFSTRKGINPWPWNPRKSILRIFPRGGESAQDFYLQCTRGRNKL